MLCSTVCNFHLYNELSAEIVTANRVVSIVLDKLHLLREWCLCRDGHAHFRHVFLRHSGSIVKGRNILIRGTYRLASEDWSQMFKSGLFSKNDKTRLQVNKLRKVLFSVKVHGI